MPRIERIFNHNAVLASGDGSRRVLMGRGLAFGCRRGDPVDMAKVEQSFTMDRTSGERLPQQLAELPLDHVRAAVTAARHISRLIGHDLTPVQLVALADHISFTVRRVEQHIPIDYPLRWDVAHLYPRETAAARVLVEHLEQALGIDLPDGEDSALALHIVNLQFSDGRVSSTLSMTQTIGEALEVISRHTEQTTPADSIPVARFVTHLRYLFMRATDQRPEQLSSPALAPAVLSAYADHLPTAREVLALLEQRLGIPLGESELTYLTLHIARLVEATSSNT